MTVIIPLAGYGTHLRPLSFSIPKPLLLCAGDTVLGWIFKSIERLSPSKIVLVLGYKGDLIRGWVNKHYADLPVRFIVQEEAKGLGHAVWKAGEEILGDGDVLIYLGDTIFNVDWDVIEGGRENFIGVKEVSDPERFGIAEIEGDKIIDLVEKPKKPSSNLAVVGLYYIKKWKFLYPHLNNLIKEGMKTNDEYQLTDALKLMLERENLELKTFFIKGWYDCGRIDTLLKTNADFLKGPPDWYSYKDKIQNFSYISKSAKVQDSSIGHFVTVGENSLIEKSNIENSIIGNAVKIVNSDIFDSVIGEGAKIVNASGKFIVGSNSVIYGKES